MAISIKEIEEYQEEKGISFQEALGFFYRKDEEERKERELKRIKELESIPKCSICGCVLRGEDGICYTCYMEKRNKLHCDGKYYKTTKVFCEKYNLDKTLVSKWLNGKKAMPERWYDKNLYLIGKEFLPYKEEDKTKNGTHIRFKQGSRYYHFYSYREFAQYANVSHQTVKNWLFCKTPMPDEWIEKELQLVDARYSHGHMKAKSCYEWIKWKWEHDKNYEIDVTVAR